MSMTERWSIYHNDYFSDLLQKTPGTRCPASISDGGVFLVILKQQEYAECWYA
jgi:hypothetical protein